MASPRRYLRSPVNWRNQNLPSDAFGRVLQTMDFAIQSWKMQLRNVRKVLDMIQVWADGPWQLFNTRLKSPILRIPRKDWGWFSDLIIRFIRSHLKGEKCSDTVSLGLICLHHKILAFHQVQIFKHKCTTPPKNHHYVQLSSKKWNKHWATFF